MTARFNHRWSVLAFALGLAACGGGGGSDSGKGGDSTTYTLSGTISVVETSAVDSDLNDPNQSGYKLNHNPANPASLDTTIAQAISTPVLLTGTVNEANTGAAGNNYASGDTDDYFKVDLTAGQVVELEFAADASINPVTGKPANDIDLYVYSVNNAGDSKIAGHSSSTTERYECVTITSTGTYYVNVSAFSGASIYSLRIGAPGTGGSCGNATAAFGTTALLAKPHAEDSAQALTAQAATAHESLLGQAGIRHEVPNGIGPHRLHLPPSTSARRAGLEALTGHGRSATAASTKSVASAGGMADVSTAAADSTEARIAAMATTLRYAKALQATGAYAYVEPDWVMNRLGTPKLIDLFPPDDRYYSYQKWHYEQIQLPAAINRIFALTTKPTRRPVVAVIDSGVALDHPDIAPQLFSNGRTFVGGTSTASGDDVSTSEDSVFHGTHVAGTIAAATFDGSGVAGVAPMAQILPLNVFGSKAGASTSDIVNAIKYAAGLDTSPAGPRRADVINMSLGGSGNCSSSFNAVITAARNAGVIVVAAAGNESASTVSQPANCTGVIAVSATQANKTLAPYSNTGSAVKVAAPGGNTGVSTTGNGQPDGIFSSMASISTTPSGGIKRVSTLGYLQGTSMASPHVAGVMALMRYINPYLDLSNVKTQDEVLSAITDDLGNSTKYGYGLLNADKAVAYAITSTGKTPPTPAGEVVATPSSLDFGSFRTAPLVLSLTYSGLSSERVVGTPTSSDPNVMTITPMSVDGNGLGSYAVSINRDNLRATANFLTITVTLSPSRTFVIPVAVSKPGSVARSGGFGPVYLLLTDAASGEVLKQVAATATPTGYTWSASGVAAGSYGIIAGTDLDNDGYICQRGEACGGYPVIEAVIDGQGVDVRGNRSDLNFQIAPLSGISALSTRSSTSQGFRRLSRQP